MKQYCYSCMEPIGDVCPVCGFRISDYRPESHQLKPGTLLRERYAVGKVLGQGGFGITYVGKDTVLDRKVAVKEFYMAGYVSRHHTISDAVEIGGGASGEVFTKNREKFLLEARTLAKFGDEPGIVGILDFFRENNTAYIVMDFLDGMTLRDYVNRAGKLSEERVLQILEPVVHSLTNVHEHGLIHRDISPDNIMLLKDGRVKLLDFGAARETSQNDIKSLSVILKPGYAPEEQYRSKGRQGPWTDVYALCATMYRCITGVVPDDAMERLFEDKLKPPAELDCDCSKAMSDVLMKGMCVRQTERYQSLPELWNALTAPEQTQKVEQPPKTEPVRKPEVPSGGSYRIVPPKGNGDSPFVWRREAPKAEPARKPEVPSDGSYRIVPPKGNGDSAFVWHRETPKAEPVQKPKVSSEGAYRIVPNKQKSGSNDAFVWHREEPPKAEPKQKAKVSGEGAYRIVPDKQNSNDAFVWRRKEEPKAQPRQNTESVKSQKKTKTQAQKQTAKSAKKKRKWPYVLWLLIMLAMIGALVVILNGSGGVPEPFNSYELTVAGDAIALPTTFETLEDMGWTYEDETVRNISVASEDMTGFIMMQKGDITIDVIGHNPTDRVLNTEECLISHIFAAESCETPGGFVVGETTLAEFEASAPDGYEAETYEKNAYRTYSSYDRSSSYRFRFLEGQLIQVEVVNGSIPESYLAEKSTTTGTVEETASAAEPAIGISCSNITEEQQAEFQIPAGVLVESVNADSDAARQGLQPNDVITAVDGTAITTTEELAAVKNQHAVGEKLALTFYRNGTYYYDIFITLTEKADAD